MDYPLRRRLYLFLMNKLQLPRSLVTAFVKGLTYLLEPRAALGRAQAAKPLIAAANRDAAVPDEAGYRLLQQDELPGTAPLLETCRRIFAAARATGALDRQAEDASKRFLVPVCETGTILLAEPAIRSFVLSAPLLGIVTRYFGRVPILSALELLWTPSNETMLKSQKFHYDTEDYRQLKLFVNIYDVTPDSGPFSLLPANRSAAVSRTTGYVGGRRARLEDDAVEAAGAAREVVQVVGPAGSGVFVDTSRCLHYGSRGNRSERLVLLVQFMDYYAPKLEPTDWSPVTKGLRGGLDEPSRLLLRC